ncbi:MAG: triose-phosphate isomerase [Candidatus Muiribacterium halophilum]|mgnify:CR=1 FL=1|uniref:Triosephosphate isomerase n=1 Tax=Muiribacterium halophilum TaxID=2053465 RepID=A0A2N5ZDY1_MUIH1|nr:MAG: triose-phosphate isomerase [Candidatus Muirbacterium halophilum]
MRKMFIAGNWKMNNTLTETVEFLNEFKELVKGIDNVEYGIAPSFVCLPVAKEMVKGTNIKILSQNMFYEDKGAYTAEISPLMLKDLNIDYVIIGHSERRQYFGETDETVNKRIKKALEHGLKVVMCIGESLKEREQGITNIVLEKQLKGGLADITAEQMKNIVIAYEPVWAIGTGKTATSEEAQTSCLFIRNTVSQMIGKETAENVRIQYGGSVKPANTEELMGQNDIDGALVGGASLKADTFIQIINKA